MSNDETFFNESLRLTFNWWFILLIFKENLISNVKKISKHDYKFFSSLKEKLLFCYIEGNKKEPKTLLNNPFESPSKGQQFCS